MYCTVDLTDGKKPPMAGSMDRIPQRLPAPGDLAQAINKKEFFP